MSDTNDSGPAYRQPWFWFVMTPLIVVVCVSLSFVTVSLYHADDRVVDNYYQQGRTINQSFDQEARARELGLLANLRFDQQTGEVLLRLNASSERSDPLPERLLLMVGHPVDADLDQQVAMLEVREGVYRGDLVRGLSHRRYLTLLPELESERMRDAEWLLRGEIQFEDTDQIELSPSDRSLPEGAEAP
ncbi:FixH family protein [Marinimicrobium sp. C2-29]|uniref:FixH family protein n=1 Tax=Marinimicrobium sp. C2-29 TaxID=3139825 RepID=UPI003139DE16